MKHLINTTGLRFNLTGQRFGILTAISVAEKPSNGQGVHWLCKCDCGGEIVARQKDMRNGNTASCGCIRYRKGMKNGTPGRTGMVALDISRPWRKTSSAAATDTQAVAPAA